MEGMQWAGDGKRSQRFHGPAQLITVPESPWVQQSLSRAFSSKKCLSVVTIFVNLWWGVVGYYKPEFTSHLPKCSLVI